MHHSSSDEPRLLVVAHGTASVSGRATSDSLVAAISHARPSTSVDLCFLDVARPRLPDALDDRPTVLVPLLLSTGYHVQTDIPAAVAGYPNVRVARHLGPHPLLVDALIDRLGPLSAATPVVLAGAGSSRSEAADELRAMATLLGQRLDRSVGVLTVSDGLAAGIAVLPRPAAIATYLLAEGQFVTTLRGSVGADVTVSPALGTHPALVGLVWQRYDDALDEGK